MALSSKKCSATEGWRHVSCSAKTSGARPSNCFKPMAAWMGSSSGPRVVLRRPLHHIISLIASYMTLIYMLLEMYIHMYILLDDII